MSKSHSDKLSSTVKSSGGSHRSSSNHKSTSSKKHRSTSNSSGSQSIKQKLKSFKTLQKSIKMPGQNSTATTSLVPATNISGTNGQSKISSPQSSLINSTNSTTSSTPGSVLNTDISRTVHFKLQQLQHQNSISAEAHKSLTRSQDNWDNAFTLESKISSSFRAANPNWNLKLKVGGASGSGVGNESTLLHQQTRDEGSVFTLSKAKKDDSALKLLSQTIRDDADEMVKKEETEIFIPGKGDLRCTLPDP